MLNHSHLRIGTRKSALAIAQSEEVCARLIGAWPELAGRVELVRMDTSGDTFLDRPLAEIGGKGLFTKEIEDALLDGRIDMAVHSMKDMQTVLPDGLIIGCMLPREDPRDRLVGENLDSIDDLLHGASFGTSSLRRSAQLLVVRPDIRIVPLRGNVQTRLTKLARGEMQATMLAQAGLNRLGLRDVPGAVLPVDVFLPAVAQGAIGIECCAGNELVLRYLAALTDKPTEIAVACERAFLRVLDGSCRTPIAGFAELSGDRLRMRGLIAAIDGSAHQRVELQGSAGDAERLGQEAGELLKAKLI